MKISKLWQSVLKIVISVLIAGVLVFYLFHSFGEKQLSDAYRAIRSINLFLLLIPASFIVLAMVLRAIRWNLMMKSIDYNPSVFHLTLSVVMTYFFNLFIPRAGEVARCTTLYKTERIPVEKSIGTVIVERIADVLILLLVLLVAFFYHHHLVLTFFEQIGFTLSLSKIVVSGTVLLMIGALFFLFRKKIQALDVFKKIEHIIHGFLEGVLSIFKLKEKGKFIFYTLAIWFCYFMMTYVPFFFLEETSDFLFKDALFVMAAGGLGFLIPASGGIGAFHGAVVLAFTLLEREASSGLAFAFLVHSTETVMNLILGLISLFFIAKSGGKTQKEVVN